MRKRDEKKDRKEIIKALSMILQIGLSMMVCMGMSLAIGFYLDKLLGTKFWMIIMMVIGVMASFRSLLVLTGVYHPGRGREKEEEKENRDGNSQN